MAQYDTRPLPIGRLYRILYEEGRETIPPERLRREQKLEAIISIAHENNCELATLTYCVLNKRRAQSLAETYEKHIHPKPPYHNDLDNDQKLEAIRSFAAKKGWTLRITERYKIYFRTED
ncbi:hypothetical protein M0R36_10700 [bacterium]|jgi:hypothetical protein|nr:hypothetical protein [bacterium]